jgi:hypothetical protein
MSIFYVQRGNYLIPISLFYYASTPSSPQITGYDISGTDIGQICYNNNNNFDKQNPSGYLTNGVDISNLFKSNFSFLTSGTGNITIPNQCVSLNILLVGGGGWGSHMFDVNGASLTGTYSSNYLQGGNCGGGGAILAFNIPVSSGQILTYSVGVAGIDPSTQPNNNPITVSQGSSSSITIGNYVDIAATSGNQINGGPTYLGSNSTTFPPIILYGCNFTGPAPVINQTTGTCSTVSAFTANNLGLPNFDPAEIANYGMGSFGESVYGIGGTNPTGGLIIIRYLF